MVGIATSGGRRGQTDLDWRVKAGLYAHASLAAGAACGVALGLLGGLLSESVRITAASLAAVALAGLGLAQLRPSSQFSLWERDCETAQSWMEHGPIAWALMNGGALGSGFMSRIGFASWYLVPLACLAFGSPLAGAVIYGLYGGVRGFAVWVWLLRPRWLGVGEDHPNDPILDLSRPGKRLSAAFLLMVATATVVVSGL